LEPLVWFEQLPGTGGELLEGIIICTGTLLACSPPTVMSAVTTGPQTYPSRKIRHSANGLPLESLLCGSGIVSTLDSRRSPEEPVST